MYNLNAKFPHKLKKWAATRTQSLSLSKSMVGAVTVNNYCTVRACVFLAGKRTHALSR